MKSFRYFSIILIFALFSNLAEARAGGGGGGGGGGGRGGRYGWLLYPVVLVYCAYVNYKINKKKKKIQASLLQMAAREPEWNEQKLLDFTRDCFLETQLAWGQQDLEKLSKILHPQLLVLWKAQIENFKRYGERDVLEEPSVKDLRIVDVKNFADDERDEFTVCIDASGRDMKYRGSQIVQGGKLESFREFWTFEREGQRWALREVSQASAWMRFVTSPIIYEPSRSRKNLF